MSFTSKAFGKITSQFTPGHLIYSLGFGGIVGAGFGILSILYRNDKVLLWDSQYYTDMSRKEYAEEQRAYFEELKRRNIAQHAAVVTMPQYNPVALRAPFKAMPEGAYL